MVPVGKHFLLTEVHRVVLFPKYRETLSQKQGNSSLMQENSNRMYHRKQVPPIIWELFYTVGRRVVSLQLTAILHITQEPFYTKGDFL